MNGIEADRRGAGALTEHDLDQRVLDAIFDRASGERSDKARKAPARGLWLWGCDVGSRGSG